MGHKHCIKFIRKVYTDIKKKPAEQYIAKQLKKFSEEDIKYIEGYLLSLIVDDLNENGSDTDLILIKNITTVIEIIKNEKAERKLVESI